jgi:hypothetical protein
MADDWRAKLLGYGSGRIAHGLTCQASEPTGATCTDAAFAVVIVDGIGERAVCERHGRQLVEWVERLEELASLKKES